MRRCFITHSNVQDLEKILAIKNKVTLMGGQFSHKLIKKITQIVSDSWTSKKCLCARQRGIPVMRLEWIDKCWEESNKGIDAFHNSFRKYRLPIFKNMIICISGVSVSNILSGFASVIYLNCLANPRLFYFLLSSFPRSLTRVK